MTALSFTRMRPFGVSHGVWKSLLLQVPHGGVAEDRNEPGMRLVITVTGPRRKIHCNRKFHAKYQEDTFPLIVRGRLLDRFDSLSAKVPIQASLDNNEVFQCFTCGRYVTYDFGCDVGLPDLAPEKIDKTRARLGEPAFAALALVDWALRESCDDCWHAHVSSAA